MPNTRSIVLILSLVASLAAAENEDWAWVPAAPLAQPRYAHAMTTLQDGRVLVAGGHGGSSYLTSCEIYDPATGHWQPTGSTAIPYVETTMVRLGDGRVMIIGGFAQDSFRSCEIYDPISGAWSPAADFPDNRGTRDAVLLANGRVLVATGMDTTTLSSLAGCYLYDPATNTWSETGALGTARSTDESNLILLDDGSALATGGLRHITGSATFLDSCERFVDGAWQPTGALPGWRWVHRTYRTPNGRVLAFGGDSAQGRACALYDRVTGTWSPAASMAVNRTRIAMSAMWDGRLVVVGGLRNLNGSFDNTSLASCEMYDPVADAWSDLPSLPAQRFYATATTLPSGQVMVAGGRVGTNLAGSVDGSALILVNRSAPTLTIEAPAADGTFIAYGQTVTISGTAADAQGIASVTYALSGATTGTGTASGTTAWSFVTSSLGSGSTVVTIIAEDGVGNRTMRRLTIEHDATSPTVAITSPATSPSTATAAALTVSGSASDDHAVTAVTYALTGATTASGTAMGTTTWSFTTPVLGVGSTTITVTAQDSSGNIALASARVDVPDVEGGSDFPPAPAGGGSRGCGLGAGVALLVLALAGLLGGGRQWSNRRRM